MHPDWASDFSAFLSDLGPCPPRHTLGRIDVDGDYCPENCRWENTHQQARARTDNVWVDDGGERVVLKDFAAREGVCYKSLHRRVKYEGQSPHEAVAALRS